MPELLLRPLAESDLLDIWSYVAQASEESANRLISEFDQRFQMLSQTPHIGRSRPELEVDGLRSFPLKSYVIYYRVTDDFIDVIRVLHARRDVGELLSEPDS